MHACHMDTPLLTLINKVNKSASDRGHTLEMAEAASLRPAGLCNIKGFS